ncbi:MAG: hypothetical protein IJ228_08130 [Succinivibrio sp.]|nr:hypothetical protein [Succinivibrio sp.]
MKRARLILALSAGLALQWTAAAADLSLLDLNEPQPVVEIMLFRSSGPHSFTVFLREQFLREAARHPALVCHVPELITNGAEEYHHVWQQTTAALQLGKRHYLVAIPADKSEGTRLYELTQQAGATMIS